MLPGVSPGESRAGHRWRSPSGFWLEGPVFLALLGSGSSPRGTMAPLAGNLWVGHPSHNHHIHGPFGSPSPHSKSLCHAAFSVSELSKGRLQWGRWVGSSGFPGPQIMGRGGSPRHPKRGTMIVKGAKCRAQSPYAVPHGLLFLASVSSPVKRAH